MSGCFSARRFLTTSLVSLLASTPAFAAINESQFSSSHILIRDVTIIGGGSSGTYAAIRLSELGHSVAVVEQEDTLGGHTNTFVDPVTGSTFDYGVSTFYNISVVADYFAHLNIPLAAVGGAPSTTDYFNFQSASPVPATDVYVGDVGQALVGYLAQLDKYPYLFSNGYQLPQPVPEDLVLPFGVFIEKYNLQGLAYIAYSYVQGLGNILAQPTLYVMKYLAPPLVTAILEGQPALVTSANHDNHALYVAAENYLGDDVLLSSQVLIIERIDDLVLTVVSTPRGLVLIKSSWLLIAIQPKLSNLLFLDLDITEISLLGQFNNSYYWNGIVRNTGIPDNVTLLNVDDSAALNIPATPSLYGIQSTGIAGVHSIYFSSPYYISDFQVQANILKTTAALVKAAAYTPSGNTEIVAFNSHAPFQCSVGVEAIQGGFYSKLDNLQGQRRTWWTGATWEAHDSSQIWNWTEYSLLPKMLAQL